MAGGDGITRISWGLVGNSQCIEKALQTIAVSVFFSRLIVSIFPMDSYNSAVGGIPRCLPTGLQDPCLPNYQHLLLPPSSPQEGGRYESI